MDQREPTGDSQPGEELPAKYCGVCRESVDRVFAGETAVLVPRYTAWERRTMGDRLLKVLESLEGLDPKEERYQSVRDYVRSLEQAVIDYVASSGDPAQSLDLRTRMVTLLGGQVVVDAKARVEESA